MLVIFLLRRRNEPVDICSILLEKQVPSRLKIGRVGVTPYSAAPWPDEVAGADLRKQIVSFQLAIRDTFDSAVLSQDYALEIVRFD
jgi:hypothetical protein